MESFIKSQDADLKVADQERFFTQYKGVVYHVVHSFKISKTHPDYDDLLQIGFIALFSAFKSFAGSIKTENDHYKFIAYAKRLVRWRLIDHFKKVNRLDEIAFSLDMENVLQVKDDFEKDIYVKSLLEEAPKDIRQYLVDVLIYGLTPSQMAKKYSVSRQTIYNRRKKVQDYLMKKELKK